MHLFRAQVIFLGLSEFNNSFVSRLILSSDISLSVAGAAAVSTEGIADTVEDVCARPVDACPSPTNSRNRKR